MFTRGGDTDELLRLNPRLFLKYLLVCFSLNRDKGEEKWLKSRYSDDELSGESSLELFGARSVVT